MKNSIAYNPRARSASKVSHRPLAGAAGWLEETFLGDRFRGSQFRWGGLLGVAKIRSVRFQVGEERGRRDLSP